MKSVISRKNLSTESIKYVLSNSSRILQCYKHLTDAYVLDFFTCSHWNRLPKSWQTFFMKISLEELCIFLNFNEPLHFRQVVPLELTCLRVLIKALSIPRESFTNNFQSQSMENIDYIFARNMNIDIGNDTCLNNKIQYLLLKHVKEKKRHEIKLFAQIIYETVKKTNCPYIVDVGSGLGHLGRLLSYSYSLKVCGIEHNQKLTLRARELDKVFEKKVAAYDGNFLTTKTPPVHINYLIVPDITCEAFVELIRTGFGKDVEFGIVGLHTCGDLAPSLLKLYRICPNIRFINIVGCCYMKLTTNTGFPLSNFLSEYNLCLSYNAREVACHALESYIMKLKAGKHWQLKIHSYRATLEYLIVQQFPELKHSALANVKYKMDMSFINYCTEALKHLDVKLNMDNVDSDTVKVFLEDWRLVVMFYTICLLFAPLIESTILLDRYLYLCEADQECYLLSAFDPLQSPRNHILVGMKGSHHH